MHKRIFARLDRLDVAQRPEEMNVPGFDFHSLHGFDPKRYSVHVNGPWCITFEFEDGEAAASISSNITREQNMVYAAKRSKNRCPTHPGALLRDDIIPATGRTKAEIAGLLGISRQHLYDILQRTKAGVPRHRGTARQAFWRRRGSSGPGCRAPTILGMRNEPKMSVRSRPSRQRPLETFRESKSGTAAPAPLCAKSCYHRLCALAVSWTAKTDATAAGLP